MFYEHICHYGDKENSLLVISTTTFTTLNFDFNHEGQGCLGVSVTAALKQE